MGIKVEKQTKVFVGNRSVFLNVTNPPSTLNRKAIALAYHYVREHQSGGVIEVLHIRSEDNYSDCLTKALKSTLHNGLTYQFMTNSAHNNIAHQHNIKLFPEQTDKYIQYKNDILNAKLIHCYLIEHLMSTKHVSTTGTFNNSFWNSKEQIDNQS